MIALSMFALSMIALQLTNQNACIAVY